MKNVIILIFMFVWLLLCFYLMMIFIRSGYKVMKFFVENVWIMCVCVVKYKGSVMVVVIDLIKLLKIS